MCYSSNCDRGNERKFTTVGWCAACFDWPGVGPTVDGMSHTPLDGTSLQSGVSILNWSLLSRYHPVDGAPVPTKGTLQLHIVIFCNEVHWSTPRNLSDGTNCIDLVVVGRRIPVFKCSKSHYMMCNPFVGLVTVAKLFSVPRKNHTRGQLEEDGCGLGSSLLLS